MHAFPIFTPTSLKFVFTLTNHSSHALQCIDGLQDLMAGSIFMSHVPVTAMPSGSSHHDTPGVSALLAPATVVIQLYFAGSISDSEKRTAETMILGLIERYICHSHAVDGNGHIGVGWSVESDVPIMSAEQEAQAGTEQEGKPPTAAVYGVLVGWQSEMAAAQWREGSAGVDFAAQVKSISDTFAFKIETVELRCHHNIARE
jgi:hypothetical protein